MTPAAMVLALRPAEMLYKMCSIIRDLLDFMNWPDFQSILIALAPVQNTAAAAGGSRAARLIARVVGLPPEVRDSALTDAALAQLALALLALAAREDTAA